MRHAVWFLAIGAVVLACVSGAWAQVVIETVPVGNTGNPGDTRYPDPPVASFGGVDYEYRIGKFEITAGQYRDFLNAVDPAGSSPYGLYRSSMDSNSYGCQITWNAGSSTYDFSGRPSGTEADWANRPVNYVSWGDAARFCNWLHNGQPTGQLTGNPPQDAGLTEDGSYYLNGATSDAALLAVVREPDGTWVIPSEDEWYKAAYHYNDSATGNYYDYPTRSDTVPGYVNDSGNLSGTGTPFTEGGTDPGNYATYDGDGGTDGIGSPYYRTQVYDQDGEWVGEWENSASPYGTFDLGANVWEWNEAVFDGTFRGLRGGSFAYYDSHLHAAFRSYGYPTSDDYHLGFRVAKVAVCDDGACDEGLEDPCTCPEDCGDPPATENECNDGIDNDCDELADCADPDCKGVRPCSVPAASAWGVALAGLLLLTVATLALRGRRLARA